MSYATYDGHITARKGKGKDTPSVTIADPIWSPGMCLGDWVNAYSEEVVTEIFHQARLITIQRSLRATLKEDGSNVAEAEKAGIDRCNDLTTRRTGTKKVIGFTIEEITQKLIDAGYNPDTPKAKALLAQLMAVTK